MDKEVHGNKRILVYQWCGERSGKLEEGRKDRVVREGTGLDVYFTRVTCLLFMVSMSVSTGKGSEQCAA